MEKGRTANLVTARVGEAVGKYRRSLSLRDGLFHGAARRRQRGADLATRCVHDDAFGIGPEE
jgi:hypothetical protein